MHFSIACSMFTKRSVGAILFQVVYSLAAGFSVSSKNENRLAYFTIMNKNKKKKCVYPRSTTDVVIDGTWRSTVNAAPVGTTTSILSLSRACGLSSVLNAIAKFACSP